MISFQISTGNLSQNGIPIGSGYSGNGDGINNVCCEDQKMHGPIPEGFYSLGTPFDDPAGTGAFSIPLAPDATNTMYGRSGFRCHGGKRNEPCDSPAADPGGSRTASEGCIICARSIREVIAADPDHRLQVFA